MDARPALDPIWRTYALPAVVTPLGGSPAAANVLWQAAATIDRIRSAFIAGAGELVDPRPRVAIRRSEIASLPQGSTILGADHAGGEVKLWRVDEVYETDPELHRAVVHA